MVTNRLALIVLLTIMLVAGIGSMLMSGTIVVPAWVLWGFFIASGNLIYTKVWHNNEVETISLVMAFTLLAIQALGWPQIAAATLLGVGLGEMFLTKKEWYKKLYNIVAITLAGVITEIVFTYSGLSFFTTIIGTAIVFDLLLFTFLVPIWLFVAKQTPSQIHESYFDTMYVVPLSAFIAWGMINVSAVLGVFGIVAIAIGTLAWLKPEYTINLWVPKALR